MRTSLSTSRVRAYLALATLAALLASTTARADHRTQARIHYERANAHYAVGEYAAAAEEFQTAYKLKPEQALLFNAAQSYRLAGNLERALTIYKNYVRLFPQEANAVGVHQQIQKLEQTLAEREAAKKAAQQAAAKQAAEQAAARQAAEQAAAKQAAEQEKEQAAKERSTDESHVTPPAPVVVAPVVVPSPDSEGDSAHEAPAAPAVRKRAPLYKQWWLWTTVGVVAVGGALTAAILISPRTFGIDDGGLGAIGRSLQVTPAVLRW